MEGLLRLRVGQTLLDALGLDALTRLLVFLSPMIIIFRSIYDFFQQSHSCFESIFICLNVIIMLSFNDRGLKNCETFLFFLRVRFANYLTLPLKDFDICVKRNLPGVCAFDIGEGLILNLLSLDILSSIWYSWQLTIMHLLSVILIY